MGAVLETPHPPTQPCPKYLCVRVWWKGLKDLFGNHLLLDLMFVWVGVSEVLYFSAGTLGVFI